MNEKLEITTTVEIVTSGYDDRWLQYSSRYRLTYRPAPGAEKLIVRFDDGNECREFLTTGLGLDFETAWSISETNAKRQYVFQGWITPTHWTSETPTRDDLETIDALLNMRLLTIRAGRGIATFTPEAQAKYIERISTHPISDKMRAIMDYQIAECDRLNTLKWGNQNGRDGG